MITSERVDKRVQAVATGVPQVLLLSCVSCGVLLWDIDAHYAHQHPPLRLRRLTEAQAERSAENLARAEAAEAKLAAVRAEVESWNSISLDPAVDAILAVLDGAVTDE